MALRSIYASMVLAGHTATSFTAGFLGLGTCSCPAVTCREHRHSECKGEGFVPDPQQHEGFVKTVFRLITKLTGPCKILSLWMTEVSQSRALVHHVTVL